MREMRNARPGKRYLAMAQAAAMPKTRLHGTAMTAISSVSQMADCAARFWKVSRNGPIPRRKAWLKTLASGASRNIARMKTVRRMSPILRGVASVTGERQRVRTVVSGIAVPPLAPDLDQVDDQQDDEGGREHHRRDGRGCGI